MLGMIENPGTHEASMSADDGGDAATLNDRLGYTLVKTALRVRQRYVQSLSEAGLLPNEHALLSTLHGRGPCHQKELAARVVLDPGDIIAYLDNLERGGNIVKARDPKDRRRQIISLTDVGRELLRHADTALDATESELFSCFDDEERTRFTTSLGRLFRHLNARDLNDATREDAGGLA